MKPLSERMEGAAENIHAGMSFNENNLSAFADEVAQLEAELENYKAGNKDLVEGFAELKAENEALRRALPWLLRKAKVTKKSLAQQFTLTADELDALLKGDKP